MNIVEIKVNRFKGSETVIESCFVNIEKISEIIPVTLCNWVSSDIGDGNASNGVKSIIHMDNGFVYRSIDSPEEILGRIRINNNG